MECSDQFPPAAPRKRARDRGFALIATSCCMIGMVGMLGLAVDLGRMYIAKNEAQAFADTAALTAARSLNGKAAGITAAQNAVTSLRANNKWNFGSTALSAAEAVVEFATTSAGPWQTNPSPATGYAYVRVTATPTVPLSFATIVVDGASRPVTARAIAGVVPANFPKGGYLPFTPFAHSLTDPDFGFIKGQEYTFLWPGNVKVGSNGCAGDNAQEWIDNANAGKGSERGYFELQSASSIRAAVLGQRQLVPLEVGDILDFSNGRKQSVVNALTELASRDSDLTAYQPSAAGAAPAYQGNGVRLVIMPVNSGFTGNPNASPPIQPKQVLGFGAFLLPVSYPNGGNKSWCAIYMGSKAVGSEGVSPHAGAGAYVTRLVL